MDVMVFGWSMIALAFLFSYQQKTTQLTATCITYVGICTAWGHMSLLTMIVMLLLLLVIVCRENYAASIQSFIQIGALAIAIILMIHAMPGISNLLLFDQVQVGALSAPFSFYYNFDKPLAFMFLLMAFPNVLLTQVKAKFGMTWLGIVILFTLLPLADAVGALDYEYKVPSWWWIFALNNLLFTCLAEEALFRGVLQRWFVLKLGTFSGIILTSIIFGLAHVAGGIWFVLFGVLAGLSYGIIFQFSGRLLFSILAHFSLNMTHFILFTYPTIGSTS